MPTLTEQRTQALPQALRDDATIRHALPAVRKRADIGKGAKPLDEVSRNRKHSRPYLFAKPAAAPAQEVLATKPAHEAIRQQWRGGLTRQVQISRDRFRAS